jgi:hypothetical protein
LAQRQTDIIMTGVKDRTKMAPPAGAMTDLLRRGIDTFVDMHQHFLTIAAKQTDLWVDSVKEGTPFEGKQLAELARDAMETFVRSQKKFLDVVAEETAHATGVKNGKPEPHRRTELMGLAREAAEALIDAQKKLLDIAAQQMSVNVQVARKTFDAINPIPPVTLSDITRTTVDSFVAAQKALLEVMQKPAAKVQAAIHRETPSHTPSPKRKPPARKRTIKPVATAAAV